MRPLVVLCLVAPLLSAGDDRPARRIPDQKLQAAVNKAIEKGIAYLRSVQNKDGSWTYRPQGMGNVRMPRMDHATGGLTALALYALGASGVRGHDRTVKRGVTWTEKNRVPFKGGASYGTYSASLLILALTRIDAAKHKKRIHRLAKRLVGAQLRKDDWTYDLAAGKDTGNADLAPMRAGRGDNSNSQFAVLALWAAHVIADAKIPRKTWERILGFYERTQLDGGGWIYAEAAGDRRALNFLATARPSMTAAGLVSYVYATAALLGGVDALPLARRSMVAQKGLTAFHVPSAWNFNNYYFVYSLERVGTVMGLPEKDWYYDGARKLVRAQAKDGRWRQRPAKGGMPPRRSHGDDKQVYETSLALLFLSRATSFTTTRGGKPAPLRPVVTTKKEAFPDCAQPANLERAFGHYVAYKAEDRKKVLYEFAKAGNAAVELFVKKLRAPVAAERAGAYDLLERLVEKKFFFQPDRPEPERLLMLRPIEEYWRVHGSSLRWDAKRKLFVAG